MSKKNVYITTTLPYVNSDPHIGFALEIIQADVIARYNRLAGNEVFFSTGTDEHGQKIFEASEKNNQDVKDYVDHYAAEFRKLKEALNISNDTFIRTTNEHHKKAAQEIWKLCDANGDIYKKSYTGQYCVGCEAYKTEKDLNEEGQCALHPNLELKTIEEENYFFKFSKYQDQLLGYLSNSNSVLPEWRKEEAITFVKNGLEDFSISREKERLSWGVPVPGDDTQVMYVWFDALTNYISTLGWPEDENGNFEKFWTNGQVIQMAGKDQIRFQSLMWQAMLFSAGIKNTDTVAYHGFITSDGQKMSKSLGNMINPYDVVSKYGVDALRYYLLAKVNTFEDGDFTYEKFEKEYQADLANGLGNLVARVSAMAEKENMASEDIESSFSFEITSCLDKFEINKAINYIWEQIKVADVLINEKKVWGLEGDEKKVVLDDLINKIKQIAFDLQPFLPETSEKIQNQFAGGVKKSEPLFPRLQTP